MPPPARIATSVLTGFLGSGKTTLLNRLLRDRRLKDAAVLVNEFGEIGIDHLLVRNVDENILRTSTGCLCCAMRGDMIGTLRDLYARREQRMVPRFKRMLIETTGLADPAPILHTLMKDPLIATRFRLDGVITTVDAVNGAMQLKQQPESVKQAAMADRLLITKTDLAPANRVDALRAQLKRVNPGAVLLTAVQGEIDPAVLLDCGLYNPRTKSPDVLAWLGAEAHAATHPNAQHRHPHDDDIRTYCLTFDEALPWPRFADAFQALVATHGERVLRFKGLLNVFAQATPVVVHGVQHLFHPPLALPAWPDADHRSRLVLITRGLSLNELVLALQSLSPRPFFRRADHLSAQA
jgi:G3E family GTPase